MKTIQIILPSMRNILYASAPGYSGLTIYWLIVIGIIFMGAYLVGGLIPKRFPDVSGRTPVQVSPRKYNDARNTLQLRQAVEEPTQGTGNTTRTASTPTPSPTP